MDIGGNSNVHRSVKRYFSLMKGEDIMNEIMEKMRKEDRLLKESAVVKAVQKELIEMGYEPFEEKVMGVYTAIDNVAQVCTMEQYDKLRAKDEDCIIRHLTNECSYNETGCSGCKSQEKIKVALERYENEK